jgi:hypothetical protein
VVVVSERRIAGEPRVAWFLVAVAALYTVAYLAHPAIPGRPETPLGWWSWFDQGEYIKSTRAFAAHDFRPSSHFYPPAYPLLGALFVGWMPVHPLFVVDLACFMVYAAGFIAFASTSVGRRWAMALFAFAVPFQYVPIFQQFVVPWTTIPVAAIVAVLAWMAACVASSPLRAAMFGALAGAIAPFRPLDMLLAAPLAASFLGAPSTSARTLPARVRFVEVARNAMILAVTAALGPLVLVAWNLRIYGNVIGAYGTAVQSYGFSIGVLPQKLTALFLDSAALNLEPHAAILERFPWIALAAFGIALTWLDGWSVASALGVSIVLQILVYACYADLSPHGLWRYGNIHYFVWMYPYLALFAFTALSRFRKRTQMRTLALIGAVIGMMVCVAFARQDIPASISIRDAGEGNHIVAVAMAEPRRVNAIDLIGWTGPYYDTLRFHVVVDGRDISRISEFRLLPADSGLRLLFLRPVRASSIVMHAASTFRVGQDPQQVRAAYYYLAMGIPRWPWRWLKGLWNPPPWF